MITTEELFAEDFKPQWLKEKQRRVKESLEEALTTEVDFAFRELAAHTRQRIASRVDRRGNYRNGLFTAASKKVPRTYKRKQKRPQ